MTTNCQHEYWAPMKYVRMCRKCGHQVDVSPMKSMTKKEFAEMYPTEEHPDAKIVYNFVPIGCDHDWGVGFGSVYSPVTYCKKCKIQKPLVPDDIFKKIMEANNG